MYRKLRNNLQGSEAKSTEDFHHFLSTGDGYATSFAHGNSNNRSCRPRHQNCDRLSRTYRFFKRPSCIFRHHSYNRFCHLGDLLTFNSHNSKVTASNKLASFQGRRFTEEFLVPFTSYLPFHSWLCFILFSEAEINVARLLLLASNMGAWLKIVAYFTQLSPLIFCDLLLIYVLWAGDFPFGKFEAWRWGTATSALCLQNSCFCGFLCHFPSHCSLSSSISNSLVDASWGILDGFFEHFLSLNRRPWHLRESAIRADFPPSRGTSRNFGRRGD